ncbi:MAG: GNAT family N-acetyltransferase [Promethearchaeota archaeon]
MKNREAEKKDESQFTKLYFKLYPEIVETNLKNIPLNKAEYKNILLIAEENRKIIGFIWGNFISFGVSRYGYIDDLFVDENYRNQRVASKLIASIKEQFKALNVKEPSFPPYLV